MKDRLEDSLENIRQELRAIIVGHMACQQKVTLRQNSTIAVIADRVLKWSRDGDQGGSSRGQQPFSGDGSNVKRSIKLDFPCFASDDPEGWLYQTNEYFAFHGIGDDSRVQIVGFHMMGKALSWI